jgi:hypothetical protein
VLLSDLLDLPEQTLDRFAALSSSGRVILAVQVLDPEEALFPFEGTVRLRALEGRAVVETDATATRERYLAALDSIGQAWSTRLTSHGGQFLKAVTTDDAASVVRSIVSAVAGRFVSRHGEFR